jgi:spermidine synthase
MKRERLLNGTLITAFGLSGAAALIYEVVWIRSLSTVMGSSVYASSTMLAAFMGGLSLGGWIGSRLSGKVKNYAAAFAWAEAGIGLTGLFTVPFIEQLNPIYIKVYYTFHLSFAKFSLVQFALCFAILAIPTTLMGITFPLVVKHFTSGGEDAGVASGRLYSINTLGAIAGSLGAGFLLIPLLGLKGATIAAAALNGLVAAALLVLSGQGKNAAGLLPLLVLAVAGFRSFDKLYVPFFTFYSANRFESVEMAESVIGMLRAEDGPAIAKDSVLFHKSGPEGDVYVLKNCFPSIRDPHILINGGRLEAGDDSGFKLLSLLPYFSHPAKSKRPSNALSIGLGSGHTLAALAERPLVAIDSVEINQRVIDANKEVLRPPLFRDRRIRHIRADGRNFLRLHRGYYDLVIVSPSWAVDGGSAGFLTSDFFETAKEKLGHEGVLAFWTDLFLEREEERRIILRTAASRFSSVSAWKTGGGMIVLASNSAMRDHHAVLKQVEAHAPELAGNLAILYGEEDVRALPPGPINTDDHPIVELRNARRVITQEAVSAS